MTEQENPDEGPRRVVLRETARLGVAHMDAGRARTVDLHTPRALEGWTVRIAAVAETDMQEILRWSAASFGAVQEQAVAQMLSQAIESLTGGPDIDGAKAREDIGGGVFILRVGLVGIPPYLVLFRVNQSGAERTLEVLRILHGALAAASPGST